MPSRPIGGCRHSQRNLAALMWRRHWAIARLNDMARITEEQWQAWLAAQPPLNPMPPQVRAEVQRILDGAARRLLREGLNLDAARGVSALHAAADGDAPDRPADERPLLVEGEVFPVRRAHARRAAHRA